MSLLSWVIAAGNKVDVLILGALLGTDDVGPYYAAIQMAGFAFYAYQSVNMILAPMIAERYEAGDLQGMESLVRQGARLGLAGSLAASILLAASGRWILAAFGDEFAVAYVPLIVLLIGYSAVTAVGPGGFVLSMTKYQNQASFFAAISFGVNCALVFALVPVLGATGAAVGAAVQLLLWHSLALRFVVKRVGINSSAFGRSLTGSCLA
jgi:O-antigen/teichoic acid export membrane protein